MNLNGDGIILRSDGLGELLSPDLVDQGIALAVDLRNSCLGPLILIILPLQDGSLLLHPLHVVLVVQPFGRLALLLRCDSWSLLLLGHDGSVFQSSRSTLQRLDVIELHGLHGSPLL